MEWTPKTIAIVFSAVVLLVILFSVVCIVSAIKDMDREQKVIRAKRKEIRRRKIEMSESIDR